MNRAHNPFAPPALSDVAALPPLRRVHNAMAMPREVLVAVGLLTLNALATVPALAARPLLSGVGLAICLTLMAGIGRRSALAWHATRVVFVLHAAIFAALLTPHLVAGSFDLTVMGSAAVALLADLAPVILLSRPAARRYFGLTCPECNGREIEARSFFFTRRQCRSCGCHYQP